MPAKRVLVTGASGFLGGRLVQALEASSEIEYIAAVDIKEPAFDFDRAEFTRADIRNPLIRRVLSSSGVDTVVHTALVSAPITAGGRTAQKESNVIGTLQLLGACQRADHVKKVIVRSSTAVYGIDPRSPSVLREAWSASADGRHGYFKDVIDAETYARDFGRRRRDVTLTVLRLTNVVGPTAQTNMTQFLSLPFVPVALGYDPRIQLIHEDDATEVLRRSVVEDHPGLFNVAADGVVYLSQAIRIARRLPFPIIAPLAELVGSALRNVGLVDFPTDQIKLAMYGRVIDNSRLKEVFGYHPKYSSAEALRDFVRVADVRGPQLLLDLQRAGYEAITTKLPAALERVVSFLGPS